jgi:hypothetical protein
MEFFAITKIICFYVLVAAGETLNGIARTVLLNRRVGVRSAKRVSMISALSLCLLICHFYVPLLHIRSDRGLLLLGVSLSSFMLVFDIVLARFVVKARWETILDDFNLFRGNLLAVGMVVMAFCPFLSSRIARIPW